MERIGPGAKAAALMDRRLRNRLLRWTALLVIGLIGYCVSGSYALDRADASYGGNQWWMQIPRAFVLMMAVAYIGTLAGAPEACAAADRQGGSDTLGSWHTVDQTPASPEVTMLILAWSPGASAQSIVLPRWPVGASLLAQADLNR